MRLALNVGVTVRRSVKSTKNVAHTPKEAVSAGLKETVSDGKATDVKESGIGMDVIKSLLQNSSNAANFDCVRGAERPTLRPARA